MPRRGLAALLLVLAGCRAPAASPAQRLERLLPALGAPEFVTLDAETRPAARLRPGEARRCPVAIGAGAQLSFALGVLPGAARDGEVRVRVELDGRELLRDAFPAARMRWWNRSVPVPETASGSLAFTVDFAGHEPLVALAAPRLGPLSAAPGRILLWISQDTLRADHLESYGYARTTAPAFARLAKEWTLFERGVAPASWTLPSLASQMTSRYPSFHGATNHLRSADPRFPTVFESLAAAGFSVVGVTGNPFVSDRHGLARGFDALVYTGLKADVVSRLALRAVEQAGGGDVALFVHYMDPHSPYQPPPPFDTRFGAPYSGAVDGYNYQSALRNGTDVEHVKDLYDGEIAYTDAEIAKLLDALADRGLTREAVIAYTADHGDEFFERGAWGHAHTLHEELVHVPFALRVPGAAPRAVRDLVSLVDLAPTLLDALGVPPPPSFQGRSLLPLVGGGSLPALHVFSETARTPQKHQVALRDGRFKYIAYYGVSQAKGRLLDHDELFDMDADPGERKPIDRDRAPFRSEVEAFLERAGNARAATTETPLAPDELERLKALGYVN